MLALSEVAVPYGVIRALENVSLSVATGQFVTVIGPNGAGKSTLLKTLSGLLQPRSGSIVFDGRPIVGRPAYEIARHGLLHVPEGRRVLGPLSVEENLLLGRLAQGGRTSTAGDDLSHVFSLFPRLKERRHQQAGSLSGGEQQMLAIGRAIMGRPRMLLLDEPSLGLAPLVVREVFEALTRINREGLTILLVEQNARRALDSTEYAYILEGGQITRHGPSAALASDPRIIDHYLGRDTREPVTTA